MDKLEKDKLEKDKSEKDNSGNTKGSESVKAEKALVAEVAGTEPRISSDSLVEIPYQRVMAL